MVEIVRKIFQPSVFQGISGYFQGDLIFGATKFGKFCVASQIAFWGFHVFLDKRPNILVGWGRSGNQTCLSQLEGCQ